MARTPLFNTLANTQKKALSCRCCGIKEFILLLAIALWSFALIVIPKRIAQAHGQGGNPWNEVGKPRVIAQPEIELAADCAARRGGPVLVVEALTSDEWTDLSAEDFESRYIRASKPVVVRDALAGTDAMGMWDSDEHLSINFGKWKVDVKQEGVAGSESKTLEWFLKRYKASAGKLHLTQRMTKRMASQVILPEVFCGVVEHGLRQDVQLSMTSGSHKGPIHCDSEDALLMQFDGSKTVYLADPALEVKKGSYRRRAFHNVAVSDIDFWKPDERRHPGFAQVRWLQVEVKAGDMLYIPAFWFHVIQSEGARNLVNVSPSPPEARLYFQDRETYDAADLDGDPDPADDDCCAECWPCKIRTFCRHTLGANPKFPACKQTLEMEGVLTPGFRMDETAGILPVQEKDGGGGATSGGGDGPGEGEDVVRSETEPDFALHTPATPDWERGGDFGYEDGVDPLDDDDVADVDGGYEDVNPAVKEEETNRARDYDGSGGGEELV